MQIAVNIVVLASMYSLVACGYVLIYKVSRVLNLAHGELMMLGAYFLFSVASIGAFGIVGSFVVAGAFGLIAGLLVYIFLMRWMTGQAVLAAVLTTISLGIFLRGAVVLIWTAQYLYPAQKLGLDNASIPLPGGAVVTAVSLTLVVSTVLVYAGLVAFLRFSRWGIRMRACGQNPLLAAQSGVNLHHIYALAWGLATFTGGLAGMLVSLETGMDTAMILIGLKAFPGALVGGLDSLLGTVIGSGIVAGAEVLLIQYVDPLLSDVVPFIVLIVVLAVRPWGLLGTREELDRV
jgi:branched-chain amino acid transport system permease protein